MSFITKIVESAINLFQKDSLAQETAARAAADKTESGWIFISAFPTRKETPLTGNSFRFFARRGREV